MAGDARAEGGDEAVISSARWRRSDLTDEYGIALLLLLLVLILPMFVPEDGWGTFLVSAVAMLGALVALHSSHVKVWLFRSACAASLASLVVVAVDPSDPGAVTVWVSYVAIGFLLIVTPIAILARIVQHQIITPRTLYGALCVYLLIGLGFSFVYQAVAHASSGAFNGLDAGDRVGFTYYSFITLTTVGYGDITPLSDTARSVATFQAVFGQIFLVVVVARVVSMLGREREPGNTPILNRIHRLDDPVDLDDPEVDGPSDDPGPASAP